MLSQAEWDVQLVTGWSCDEMDDLEAERLLTLHLRWQYNQMRFSGLMGGKRSGGSRSARAEHWKSQTTEHGGGRVTKRVNIEDLFNPNTARMINNLRG